MLDQLTDILGDQYLLALSGALIGVLFGAFAQYSRFCLRSAVVEVARRSFGERTAVWLLAFSTTLIATQAMLLFKLFDTSAVRALNNAGSLSGAVIGGLIFGAGMILARACPARMIVLSAGGNLRALTSLTVFAVVTQIARGGALSPLRAAINAWWTIGGPARDLLAFSHVGYLGGIMLGVPWLVVGIAIAVQRKLRPSGWITAVGIGMVVAAAWWLNFHLAATSFDVVPVQAVTFSTPLADVLMYLLSPPGSMLTFGLGLVPGALAGGFLTALLRGELKIKGFEVGASMPRYITGSCLMAFGAVLAGGCSVGVGLSGSSIFALTAWVGLSSMWFGAIATDRLTSAVVKGG